MFKVYKERQRLTRGKFYMIAYQSIWSCVTGVSYPLALVLYICKEEKESISLIFMHFPQAREVWHASPLSIKTSDLIQIPAKQWIVDCIMLYKLMVLENIHVRSGKLNWSTSLENDNMCYVSFRIWE